MHTWPFRVDHRYVVAVASSTFAESVIWCRAPAFDAVLVLGSEIPQHSGLRTIVLSPGNHYLGWALGRENSHRMRRSPLSNASVSGECRILNCAPTALSS